MIQLFQQKPETPAPLPPARLRLREHYDQLRALAERGDALMVHRAAAQRAEAARNDAQRALDDIAEADAERWRNFVEAGAQGTPPAPLTEERARAAAKLAEAKAEADIARQRADALAPTLDANYRQHVELASRTRSLIEAALLETATELGERYKTVSREAMLLEAALNGILQSLRCGASSGLGEQIWPCIVGGPPAEAALYKEQLSKTRESIRAAWSNLLARLTQGDCDTEFPLDDEQPASEEQAA